MKATHVERRGDFGDSLGYSVCASTVKLRLSDSAFGWSLRKAIGKVRTEQLGTACASGCTHGD